ncbi:Hypothetical protein R9X50_00592700 [Acrodontium crateriforme]|uniref:Uncharacterized protein n=1 Tax=Acrodontium crateriforme TaxID=150365 RepID=A0AAQ3MA90_9PEZI|nr:Hypothetical protein R9X50_00592700 [Acrodontium crateriforme]
MAFTVMDVTGMDKDLESQGVKTNTCASFSLRRKPVGCTAPVPEECLAELDSSSGKSPSTLSAELSPKLSPDEASLTSISREPVVRKPVPATSGAGIGASTSNPNEVRASISLPISSSQPVTPDYFRRKPVSLKQTPSENGGEMDGWSTASTPSTIYSRGFSVALTETISPATTIESSSNPSFPPLDKPIVIPRVLNHTTKQYQVGVPYHRVYANILAQYEISQDRFLGFIDELNLELAGHVAFTYVKAIGQFTDTVGNFDPTNITSAVGKTLVLGTEVANLARIKAKQKSILSEANQRLFNPVGLQASILSCKELRKMLGLYAKHPLTAPLMTNWTVPTKDALMAGQRAKCRTLGRIIYHLLPYAQDLTYCTEANDALTEEGSHARKEAARKVRTWQVQSEVQHELWRGQALDLYARAAQATSVKENEKWAKKAATMDKEAAHVKYISWLVIWNFDGGGADSPSWVDSEMAPV